MLDRVDLKYRLGGLANELKVGVDLAEVTELNTIRLWVKKCWKGH